MLNVDSKGSTALSGYSVNGAPTPSSNNRNALDAVLASCSSLFFIFLIIRTVKKEEF